MKKTTHLKIGLLLMSVVALQSMCYAQLEELGNFMAAGKQDAEVLLQPYIAPAVNAFGAALSGGWYNTAAAHKLGGFDLTITANVAIIPTKYETSVIDNSKLSLLQLSDPANNSTPTIAGGKSSGPELVYKIGNYTAPAFTMPSGLNSNYIPAPMIQAGIGLIKGTEIMGRFLPTISVRGNEIGLWGIGGKHDIKQWIPGLKRLPVLQMSIMYGFTKLHTFVNLNVSPNDINAGSLPGATSSTWDNQQIKLVTRSQTANLIISANLPVVCFYGGIGFVTTKTNLKLAGDYPSVYLDGIVPSVQALTDPVDMNIKNKDGSITKPRFNAGIRFKLAVITIHFDYSWANYSVVTAGLGVSFR
jgi:hypothetical protein